MKNNIFKISLLIAFAGTVFASCQKQETLVTVTNSGTVPVLTSSIGTGDTIPLIPADSLNTAVAFTWTNPNYVFSDGISSLNVTYNLQVDTVGGNFSSSHMQQISISSSLDTTFTVTQFNTIIGNGLQVTFGQPHNIQVRLESYLTPLSSGSANALPLYSNVFNYTVTPYAPPPKVTPPSNGQLYIVGSAVAADNWANPMPAGAIQSETFTQVSPTEYKITIPLVGGGEYKLIDLNGSWTDQWSVATADTYPNGGPFVYNGNNCIAPATSGTYVIDVNFQTGIFTVTAQ